MIPNPAIPLKLALALHLGVSAVPAHVQHGKASYYSNGAYGGQGHCAHKTIPKGTRISVTGTHGTALCIVTDRGPYVRDRIVDLNINDFVIVDGSTSAGVAAVTIRWPA